MNLDLTQQLADRFNELQIPKEFQTMPDEQLIKFFDRPDGKINASIFPPSTQWRTVLRVLQIP